MMNRQIFMGIAVAMSLGGIPQGLSGDEVLVRTPSGGSMTVEVESEQPFASVVQHLEEQVNDVDPNQRDLNGGVSYVIDFGQNVTSRSVQTQGRDYYRTASSKEREDINFIIRTLAKASWTELLKSKSNLKKAGDRTDRVHPLRYLLTIFSDNDLKDAFHCMHSRSKIWSEFYSQFSESLKLESSRNNMTTEYIKDFATTLRINYDSIATPIQQERWQDFINQLLTQIPRSGNTGRYES